MSLSRKLSEVLAARLPIPLFMRRNIYIERVLQERRAAATAFECLEENLVCLEARMEDLEASDPEGRATLAAMRDLIADSLDRTRFDEIEMEHAAEEI